VAETFEIRVPELGDGQEEALLIEWQVKPGETIAAGAVVAVVETEKASVEVEAAQGGTILDILCKEGESVPVGCVLALLRPAEAPAGKGRPTVAQRLSQDLGVPLNQLVKPGEAPSTLPDHLELRRHIETARQHLQQIRSRVHDDLDRAEAPLAQALEDLETTLEALHRSERELQQRRREVTELHRDQQEALGRYQELFAFAPDGYLVTDTEGIIEEINQAALELLKGSAELLVGAPLEDFIDPVRREPFRARLRALVEGRASRIQDWQLRMHPRGDTEGFEAELTVEPVAKTGGREGGLRWLVRDVTQRRQAEEVLHSTMAHHRALLEAAVDGILTIDAKGTIQSVNPAVEKIFGYGEEELLGRNVSVLMSAADRGRHDGYLERYHRTGEKRIIGSGREVVGRRRSGELFPVDLAVSELRVGDRVGFVGILRDITDRREMEEALRRERDFAESLVETAQAIVLVLDPQGRVVRFNRYMESLTGYTLEELQGKDWFSTILPEGEQEAVRQLFRSSVSGTAAVGNLNPILTRDGKERMVEWYDTTLRDGEGGVAGILAVGLDVTERIRLEERFRQAQKMEAVGRLAGGVAHDFNTLLGSIIGYSELLLGRLPEGSAEIHPVHQIHRGAQRGAALTRQLLAFSRRQVVQPVPLNLNSVVTGMEDMLRRLIGEDIRFNHRLDSQLGTVLADAGQLEQVVMNLTVNAVDAMPSGGDLTLHTRRADHRQVREECSLEVNPGHYALLIVEDTGHGIDPEVRHHIFEPFFTTKERGKGTGLGLSTVYGILQQSGGGITVDSAVGQGTQFKIYLPEAEGEPVTPEPTVPQPPTVPGRSEAILLVEDDEMFLELLTEVLTTAGYSVTATSDPLRAEALAEGLAEAPRLLISDMVMPGLSGNRLANRLVERFPELRVLLMSGYTDEALEVRGVDTMGLHFIQKPFSTRRLVDVVRQILDGTDTLVMDAD
jgi:PAS domain S-box-containing protein